MGLRGNQDNFYLLEILSHVLKNRNSEIHSCLLSFPESFLSSPQFSFIEQFVGSVQQENFMEVFKLHKESEQPGVKGLLSYHMDFLR